MTVKRRLVGSSSRLLRVPGLRGRVPAAQVISPVWAFEPRRNMRTVKQYALEAPNRLAWQSEPFSIEVRPARERVVVVPCGQLDVATVGQLAAAINELAGRGSDAIALDLRETSFMDSSGVHLSSSRRRARTPRSRSSTLRIPSAACSTWLVCGTCSRSTTNRESSAETAP